MIAAELLRRTRHVLGQPMCKLARALGHEVRFKKPITQLPLRGFALKAPNVIYVLHAGYTPRIEFTIAHEIIELHMPRAVLEGCAPTAKERLCDRGAAALLLPRDTFLDTISRCDAALPELRRRFPLVSYEVLASRVVELRKGTYAAAWRSGVRRWWRGTECGELMTLGIVAECRALREARRRGRAEVCVNGYRARAWRLSAAGQEAAVTLVERA